MVTIVGWLEPLLQTILPLHTDHNQAHHNVESPQRATREIVPLTQEDIPRIIEGVVKSLTEIDYEESQQPVIVLLLLQPLLLLL